MIANIEGELEKRVRVKGVLEEWGGCFFMRWGLREIEWKKEVVGVFNLWYVVSGNNR